MDTIDFNFGEFIEKKRKEKDITLRGMAETLGIAPAYMSDIEKGRRYPPDMDKLLDIARILNMSEEERDLMFDLAGEGKSTISPDLPEYIMSSDIVRVALRKAKNTATEEDWAKFLEILKEKGNGDE